MEEITQSSRGLSPYAPEFLPLHKRLSLSRSTASPAISYYAPSPSPPNPNLYSYYPFRVPYFHSIPNPNPTHNYPDNPYPNLTTLQLQVQPSTEVAKPPTALHTHEEEKQQQHGHGRVHTKKAMAVPPNPRRGGGGHNGNFRNFKRLSSFGRHGGRGSRLEFDTQNYKRGSYYKNGKIIRREVKPRSSSGFGLGNNNKGHNSNLSKLAKNNGRYLHVAMSEDYLEWSPVHDNGLKTTLMIRNIPNRIKVHELMKFLDDHCAVENGKPEVVTGGGDKSAYDFLYLPVDFGTWSNKGYAFVNFTNPKAAWKFYLAAKGRKWDLHRSQKICDIVYARIQGKENLVSHFKTMDFTIGVEHKIPKKVLPVCFKLPRDGSRSDVQSITLGIFHK